MGNVTYYVAIPFGLDDEGNLCAGEPVEAPSAPLARTRAERLAGTNAGAIAFSRTGDPNQGDFDDAVVIARFGEVPSDVAAYVL